MSCMCRVPFRLASLQIMRLIELDVHTFAIFGMHGMHGMCFEHDV